MEHETAGTIRHQISLPQALAGLRGGLVGIGGQPIPGRLHQVPPAIKTAGLAQHRSLPLGPLGVMPRQGPDGKGSGRGQGIVDQGFLKPLHGKLGRKEAFQHTQGGRQTGRLSDVEHQGLEAGGAVGHMTHADALVGGEQILHIAAHQGAVGNGEGCTAPAPTPAAAFRRQRPVRAGVVVIVGVIAHRNGAADTALVAGEGGDAGPLGYRQQLLLEHQVTSKQAPAFAPVGHQGQRLAALQ